MKIYLLTLGCAKNRVDSECLAGALKAASLSERSSVGFNAYAGLAALTITLYPTAEASEEDKNPLLLKVDTLFSMNISI